MFNGPIPGESLTREKGNAPWEQPAQYDTVEEVVGMYLDKFDEDDEKLEELFFILDQGMPLDLLVNTILLNGEMLGKHSYDVSELAGPVIHEHLLMLAEAAGVDVVEFEGVNATAKEKEKLIKDMKVVLGKTKSGSLSKQINDNLPEAMERDAQSEANPTEAPAEEAPMEAPAPAKGLMARRPTNV